jgi:hypothetical protein
MYEVLVVNLDRQLFCSIYWPLGEPVISEVLDDFARLCVSAIVHVYLPVVHVDLSNTTHGRVLLRRPRPLLLGSSRRAG